MRWVVGALVIVAALAVVGSAFGIAGGLRSDFTAGPEGRPWLLWTIAICSFGVEMIFWPALASWYLTLELPTWHRRWLLTRGGEDHFEDERRGRRVLDWARTLAPGQRSRLARRVLGYGLFYVTLTVPAPILLGVGALRLGSFEPIEAIPLILAVWAPAVWTAVLVTRSVRHTKR
jgi:hypothetical protein